MKIVFAGIIARYPFGGVTWCSLMYLLGLRALGHEVLYIEDTGECIYDPEQDARLAGSRRTAPATSTMRSRHSASATAGASSTTTGRTTACRVRRCGRSARMRTSSSTCRAAPGSGATNTRGYPRRVFVDSDPVFTQLAIAKGEEWYVDFFRGFDRLFTFGANIGTPASDVPTSGVHLAQDMAAGRHRSLANRDAARPATGSPP